MKIHGRITDVRKRKIIPGYIDVRGGRIAAIVPCKVAGDAPYILPGFIDSHIHVESTLVIPEKYAAMAVAKGCIGAVCDPHEIANVLGIRGVEYMIRNGKKVRFHFTWAAPSCVPSTPFETSGAVIDSVHIRKLLSRKEVFGLGEMMNVPGVLFSDRETMAKIRQAQSVGKLIDGHCPGLSGKDLRTYVAAGISTDHETISLEEGREKLSCGMYVCIREGSAACSFDDIWPLLNENPDRIMFCSDDKYPDELSQRYLEDMVRRAVRNGVSVWDALKAASINPIEHYRLSCGQLREGDKADFILVNNLKDFDVQQTWIQGHKVFDTAEGCLIANLYKSAAVIPASKADCVPNKFKARPIEASALKVKPQGGQIKVIGASDGSLYTTLVKADPKTEGDNIISDTKNDVLKLVICNRYDPKAAPAMGFIRGFGLKKGAMASTIAHDSHNIIALGCSDAQIADVINALVREKGGIAVSDGNRTEVLPLPVAGLMSAEDGSEVASSLSRLKTMARSIGCRFDAPFMTMAFMALPVIPELKITDKGLFDYSSFGFTSLFT